MVAFHREEFAARYFSKFTNQRILSLSHFNSQWLEFIYVIGCHPIDLIRPKEHKIPRINYHFRFKLFSWITLYTAIILCLSIGYFIFWFTELHYSGGIESIVQERNRIFQSILEDENMQTKKDNTTTGTGTGVPYNPFNDVLSKDALPRLCLESVSKFIPLSGITYILSSFFSTPHFIRFLNGANDFENRIRKLFPEVVDISLAHLHYFRLKVIVSNILVFSIFTFFQAPLFYSVMKHTTNFVESKLFLALLMVCLIGFYGIFDDTKALIMLKIVEEYFQQIIDGVSNYRLRATETCVQDIQKWRSLVHLARQQAKTAVLAMEGSTLSSLFGIHLILTTSIYLMYCVIYKDLPDFVGNYALGAFLYVSVIYARLYFKAILAESITKKENELAENLRVYGECPVGDAKIITDMALSTAMQVEISFITDPIVSKPTRCDLNSSITLKVALMLGIFRNVSTYAVALIQLDTVQTSLANTQLSGDNYSTEI